MTQESNDRYLELTPEIEENYEIAPDEPFSEGMILVPVVCGTCKLRMYASEKQIGKRIVCPDCERTTVIRAVPKEVRVVVDVSEDGALTLVRQSDDGAQPAFHPNVDYRTVPGNVDEDAEKMPFLDLPEDADDPLETFMERFFEKKDPTSRSQKSKTFQAGNEIENGLSPNGNAETGTRPTTETEPERLARLIQKNFRQNARVVPNQANSERLLSAPKRSEVVESNVSSIFASKRSTIEETKIESNGKSCPKSTGRTFGNPWKPRRFVYPFLDPANRPRFFFGWLCGTFAVFMSFNLSRFFGQFLFSADPRGSSPIYEIGDILLFYTEYLLALLPLAIWLICLTLDGTTLFSKTRDGFNKIEKWILFRTEFAASYLFWFLSIAWIAPTPGIVASLTLKWLGIESLYRILLVPASLFFFFPIFFLSVVANGVGLELFQRGVWRSLFDRFFAWFLYYLISIPLAAILAGIGWLGFWIVIFSVQSNFFVVQAIFILAAIIFCPLTTGAVYLYFRLLGSLAWTIEQRPKPPRKTEDRFDSFS